MTVLKDLRKKSSLTQRELAEQSGLSLRTIQRLEAEDKEPSSHTLKAISNIFDLEPAVLKQKYEVNSKNFAEKDQILLINLSALAFIGIPFGNILIPFLIWRRKKKIKLVNEAGRTIINFQIIWSTLLCFSLSIAPFIETNLPFNGSLILYFLFISMAVNIIAIFCNSFMINRDKYDFLKLPFSLI